MPKERDTTDAEASRRERVDRSPLSETFTGEFLGRTGARGAFVQAADVHGTGLRSFAASFDRRQVLLRRTATGHARRVMLVVLTDMTLRPFPRMPRLREYRATNVKEALIADSTVSSASTFQRSGTVGMALATIRGRISPNGEAMRSRPIGLTRRPSNRRGQRARKHRQPRAAVHHQPSANYRGYSLLLRHEGRLWPTLPFSQHRPTIGKIHTRA